MIHLDHVYLDLIIAAITIMYDNVEKITLAWAVQLICHPVSLGGLENFQCLVSWLLYLQYVETLC